MQHRASTEMIKILLVEDDDLDFEAIKRRLKKENIECPLYHADCGIAALNVLRGNHQFPFSQPYIMLVDLNMPRMNGLEMLRELRHDARLKSSIVFVLTTSAREEDKTTAYSLGVAGYFLKKNLDPLIEMLGRYQRINEFPQGMA